ncbi:MAG: hypothetical protein H5T73_01450 [Actinobacteria bacterium]|nr:hypothetical protein [Actinomycetota bacterium]
MDEAAEAVKVLYEGRRVNTAKLDWRARVKFLRLQAAAAYAGYRLLYHVGRIRDAEFMQIVLSTVEDCDPLLDDALEYSLEKSVVGLASLLQAVALFC